MSINNIWFSIFTVWVLKRLCSAFSNVIHEEKVKRNVTPSEPACPSIWWITWGQWDQMCFVLGALHNLLLTKVLRMNLKIDVCDSQCVIFHLQNPQIKTPLPVTQMCDCFAEIIEWVLLLNRSRRSDKDYSDVSLTFRNGKRQSCQLLRLEGYLATEKGFEGCVKSGR